MATIGNAPVFPTQSVLPGNLEVTGNATINGTTNSVGALTENGNAALVVDKTSQPLDISSSAGNGSIKINANGYVTQPNTIFVHGQGMIPAYSNGVTARWTAVINDGNCYDSSNGRFTAPVAGTYMFMLQGIASVATSILRWYPFKNGVHYEGISGGGGLQFRQETTSGDYQQNSAYNIPIPLAENDYVYFTANDGVSVYGFNDPDNLYHGYYVYLIK